jgi:hypothetical protein
VCTDIIHYEEKKLVHYPGNLSEFVKARCPSLVIKVPSSIVKNFLHTPHDSNEKAVGRSVTGCRRWTRESAWLHGASPCGSPAVMPLLCAQVKPEARTYYELSAATLKFVFPRPGFLEGIKGRSQAITKMTNVRDATCTPLLLLVHCGSCMRLLIVC